MAKKLTKRARGGNRRVSRKFVSRGGGNNTNKKSALRRVTNAVGNVGKKVRNTFRNVGKRVRNTVGSVFSNSKKLRRNKNKASNRKNKNKKDNMDDENLSANTPAQPSDNTSVSGPSLSPTSVTAAPEPVTASGAAPAAAPAPAAESRPGEVVSNVAPPIPVPISNSALPVVQSGTPAGGG